MDHLIYALGPAHHIPDHPVLHVVTVSVKIENWVVLGIDAHHNMQVVLSDILQALFHLEFSKIIMVGMDRTYSVLKMKW
jgi:hypothetical protein